MKLINHIIKEKGKYCTICKDTHTIPTLVVTETITHNGIAITYPTIYDYCYYTQELIPNAAYTKTNRKEFKKACAYHQ